MEPRPHERGNKQRFAERNEVTIALQWSHVLTNVETEAVARHVPAPELLQWSHVLTNVETPQPHGTERRVR